MTVGARIQLRRDTAANWTSANPILSLAEPGYEKDTGKEKRGDGVTAWNSLPYFAPGTGTFDAGQPVVVYVGGTGASNSNSGKIRSSPLATVGAALAALPTAGGRIVLAPNVTTAETGALSVDASKVSIEGDGSLLTWATVPGAGYCIRFFLSSPAFGYGGRPASRGVRYGVSGSRLTGVCIQVGDGTNQCGDLAFVDGTVSGFSEGIHFVSNTYRITFDRFDCRGAGVSVVASVANFGESMVWRNSILSGLNAVGALINLTAGYWTFSNCRLDSAPLVADGNGAYGNTTVMLRDCHLENPFNDVYYYLTAQNSGRIDVSGGNVIVDNPGGSGFAQGLFYSASTAAAPSGIFVHGDVMTPYQSSYFTRPQGGASRLIDGTGGGWVADRFWVSIGATGAPAFTSGFSDSAATNRPAVSYRMTEGGTLKVRGSVAGGSGFSTVFTLPARYRPTTKALLPCNSGYSLIVDIDGAVTPSSAAQPIDVNLPID